MLAPSNTMHLHHSRSVVLLVLFSIAACTNAWERTLQVSISPNTNPVTVPFDKALKINSSDLDLTNPNDPRIAKKAPDCEQPEQVHLTYWSSTAVLVSWLSCDAKVGQTTPVSTDGIKSVVYYGTDGSKLDKTAEGVSTSYAYDYTSIDAASYASPVISHVLLKDLQPGTTYYYKVADTTGEGASKLKGAGSSGQTYNFQIPKPSNFPVNIGVIGDPGQTSNTSVTLDRLISSNPQLLILLGDFAYADNWRNSTTFSPPAPAPYMTYQPKWDTWGRLFEQLLAHVPLMHVNANHEIEQQPSGQRDVSYNHRFPTPQLTGFDYTKAPTNFPAVTTSQPFANLYYTVELPGVLTYIALTSYAPGQTFSHDEEQYTWLEQTLKKIDRSQTPWLIVVVHAPWYHTYAGHYKEVECFRQSYEPLLVEYQVDLVMSGHVHAYERTKPVVEYKVNECGPVYLTVGDGGNIEGIYKDYVDRAEKGTPAFCNDPEANKNKLFPRYQPQACITYQDGKFCPSSQPEWSAYREPSFGFGNLVLESATNARWSWKKNEFPEFKVADEVTITRGGDRKCGKGSANGNGR